MRRLILVLLLSAAELAAYAQERDSLLAVFFLKYL